jgi:hypothetical protein
MKYIIPSLFFLLFSSCGLDNSYYLFRNFERDQVLTSTIGSPMIDMKIEYKNNVYNVVRSSMQYELIYSGKAGTVIKVVYREFSNDLARPAFSQELQYDLNESKIVKFRKTTIEVIQATNQEITYKVLESPQLKYKQGRMSKEDESSLREENK